MTQQKSLIEKSQLNASPGQGQPSASSKPKYSSSSSPLATAHQPKPSFVQQLFGVFHSGNRAVRRSLAYKARKGRILFKKVSFREVLTGILLVIPATSSAMLTYYGVSIPLTEQGGTMIAKGQALAFAITMATFSWVGWFYLFGLIYRMRGLRLTSSLLAGVIYVGTFSFIDAPFNALALGGGSAVQMTLVDTAEYYEERKQAVFKNSTQAQKLLPAMKAQAKRFRQLEQNEIAYGSRTKSKGAGKVSDGFGQIATLLETLVTELESGLSLSRSLQADIATTFSAIKREAYVAGPIRPRVNRVSVAADELDDLLGRLEQQDFATSVRAILESLKAIFPSPTVANSAFQKTQNAELAEIAAMAAPIAKGLETGLDELTSIVAVERKSVRPLSALMAIRTKRNELFSQWLAAFFVNLAPAALLIILIGGYREAERRAEEHTETINKQDEE